MKKTKNNSGFTLIEALVLLFIFSIITITFYQVISVGTRYIIFSKNRLGAIALANEKMEIARNLKYDDVGIQNGACAGNIPQDEDVAENGRNYHVHTLAAYVDDEFDGTLGGSPNDTAYKDYKLVKITVSWGNSGADAGSVFLLSRFVPPGLEAATSGDGILSINIFSDQDGGAGVPQATVEITNSDLGFSETRQTDDSGNIMLVGVKESIQRYKIKVSKSDYETVETMLPYPDTLYNPTNTHASVVAGSINPADIALNKTADLKIITQDYFGNAIADVNFTLEGGRKIGTEVLVPYSPVYNLDETNQTNSSGEKEYNSISPGQYTFKFTNPTSDYELIGTDSAPPISLSSEQNLNLKVVLAPKNVTSALIKVRAAGSIDPFVGAKIELSNTSGYSEDTTTDGNGTAFFPKTESTPLEDGIYNLKITADGYREISGEIEINNGELKVESVELLAV
ncbi:MAG: prepilin-type N-terminal cleavage/methylation domain-containing protein [Parcubacteria group bacterium]|jgi:competence protein ComGC